MRVELWRGDTEVVVKTSSMEFRDRACRIGFAAHGDIIGTGAGKRGQGVTKGFSADDTLNIKLDHGTPRSVLTPTHDFHNVNA